MIPGQTYFYMVGDQRFDSLSDEANFTVLPLPTVANLPFTIGV